MNRTFAAAAVALLVALATGCSSPSSATPASAGARHRLARTVLALVDAEGIPVEDDSINCRPAANGEICYGFTSTEPVEPISGRFTATETGPDCPGTLTITLGPSPGYLDSSGPTEKLLARAEDPCR
jgi:hypothetical protein